MRTINRVLSVLVTLLLTAGARADDKETIEALKKENLQHVLKLNESLLRELQLKQQLLDATTEAAAAKKDTAAALARVVELQKQIVEVQKATTEAKLESVDAKIAAAAAMARVERMMVRIEELEKTITQMANRDRAKEAPAKLDPLVDARGQVTAVSESGLVVVTIGSDAGLKVGNDLFIYRPAKELKDAKYIGKVRLIRLEPKQALGQFTPIGGEKTAPEKGDEVTSVEPKR